MTLSFFFSCSSSLKSSSKLSSSSSSSLSSLYLFSESVVGKRHNNFYFRQFSSKLDPKIMSFSNESQHSQNDKKHNYTNSKWYAEESIKFNLDKEFLRPFTGTSASYFKGNGLGELVYQRTYSRFMPELDRHETWPETVKRVVEGTFTIRKRWLLSQHAQLEWKEAENRVLAERMFIAILERKFLPPGRGLWAMGSALTNERFLFASLHNCAFVSTAKMFEEGLPSDPFTFLMEASMLGVGVGFDTRGVESSHNRAIKGPLENTSPDLFVVPDSREGWVSSLSLLINSYFLNQSPVTFDYSKIRPAGALIKGFGGVCSGPKPLEEMHNLIRQVLDENTGKSLTVTALVDIMNIIGKCVVSGNVRRSAEIAFGRPDSQEYVDLKNYDKNPRRMAFGWTSNNSVICPVGMTYSPDLCKRVLANGEPGFFWLENAQKFGRLMDPQNDLDVKAMGGNPCLEQTLESYELCCLVETFPNHHGSMEEFLNTLELAFLYAKTVTLLPTHWPRTNKVQMRNRRIGTSLSGIAQFLCNRGLSQLRTWCISGYARLKELDQRFSGEYGVSQSIKISTIKPSGTVSLLAGATPGMHFPESRFCIRRVRLARDSPLVAKLQNQGFGVEPCVGSEETTVVVEFPIDMGKGVRTLDSVSMWEQLELAAFLQHYWSDNQVSCTVTVDPDQVSWVQLATALDYYQYRLKGVSFLPRLKVGAYPQMPYEGISEERYQTMAARVKKVKDSSEIKELPQSDLLQDNFCSNDNCTL